MPVCSVAAGGRPAAWWRVGRLLLSCVPAGVVLPLILIPPPPRHPINPHTQRSLGKSKQPPASPGSSSSSSKKPAQQPGGGLSGLGGLQQQQGGGGGFGGLSSLFGKKAASDGSPAEKAGFGGGGFGGAGGSGGSGGWNWGGSGTGGEGDGEADKPIQQELADLARGMWVVFWNAALFLAVADVLHRSLDWCCQVRGLS